MLIILQKLPSSLLQGNSRGTGSVRHHPHPCHIQPLETLDVSTRREETTGLHQCLYCVGPAGHSGDEAPQHHHAGHGHSAGVLRLSLLYRTLFQHYHTYPLPPVDRTGCFLLPGGQDLYLIIFTFYIKRIELVDQYLFKGTSNRWARLVFDFSYILHQEAWLVGQYLFKGI